MCRQSLQVLFLLGLARAAFAAAPDSLAGKAFHTSLPTLAHSLGMKSIVLGSDGHFTSLIAASSQPPSTTSLVLLDPPADGSFTYVRTGETTGQLTCIGTDQAQQIYRMDFSTPTSGVFQLSFDSGTFFISDPDASNSASLLNIALRGRVGPGQSLIAGLAVPGVNPRELLIRVAGPALKSVGIDGVWADPDFQIFNSSGQIIETLPGKIIRLHSGDWSSAANSNNNAGLTRAFQKIFTYVGEFPFAIDSKDAAEVVRLPPGIYTVVATPGSSDPGGEALIEIYTLP